MDLESPDWERWESEFMALSEQAEKVGMTPEVKGSKHYLCLVGDNGLTPEEEFEELETMRALLPKLKKIEIETGFWQDTILFIPS